MSPIKFIRLTKLEWALFFFLFLAYAFFFNEYPGYNANTRMDLIFAIVDQGKLNIDFYWDKEYTPQEYSKNTAYHNEPSSPLTPMPYEYLTRDVAFYNGHYYCDKSPVVSYLGVPIYWIYGQLCDLFSIPSPPEDGRYWVTLFVISLPSAILSVLLYRLLGFIRQDSRHQLIITLFYSLGTPAFPYSILFLSSILPLTTGIKKNG